MNKKTNMFLSAFVSMVIALGATVSIGSVAQAAEGVNVIPDAALQGCINNTMGVPADTPITDEVIAAYPANFISCNGVGVQSLQGIEGFTSVTSISLTYNNITDASPLAALTQITDVDVSNNPIADVSFVSSLPNLIILGVNGLSGVTDWSYVYNLPVLVSLSISDANLTEIDSFIPLADTLQSLNVGNTLAYQPTNNKIANTATLSQFVNLRNLNINNNPIESLIFFTGLTNLQFLEVANTGITTLDYISALDLQSLNANFNNLNTVAQLSNMVNMRSLSIAGSPVTDTTPISVMTKLNYLNIADTNITDINNIGAISPTLEELALGNNSYITDFSAFSQMGTQSPNGYSRITGSTKQGYINFNGTVDANGTVAATITEPQKMLNLYGEKGANLISGVYAVTATTLTLTSQPLQKDGVFEYAITANPNVIASHDEIRPFNTDMTFEYRYNVSVDVSPFPVVVPTEQQATVLGEVFVDTNSNGFRDNSEALYVGNIEATLNGAISTQTSNGSFTFGIQTVTDANKGATVSIETPTGYTLTTLPNPNAFAFNNNGLVYSSNTVSFGIVPTVVNPPVEQSAPVSGFVFLDDNKNGVREAGEELYTTPVSINFEANEDTVLTENGEYSFGVVTVTDENRDADVFISMPEGYTSTTPETQKAFVFNEEGIVSQFNNITFGITPTEVPPVVTPPVVEPPVVNPPVISDPAPVDDPKAPSTPDTIKNGGENEVMLYVLSSLGVLLLLGGAATFIVRRKTT